MQNVTDFIVVGSGIAGLHAALTLAEHGQVHLFTKARLSDSATMYAQGGIAAVGNGFKPFPTNQDTIHSHIYDTVIAGNHHNDTDAVTFLVEQGAAAISKLADLGVPFDRKGDGSFATSFEAAHTHPRIFHATDFTGQEIQDALIRAVLSHPNIQVAEHAFVSDLIVRDDHCIGVQVYTRQQGSTVAIESLFARGTVLATGGVGQVYQWTVNPSVSTGDGIAMAHRVGARITDMEFVQFHPTAFKDQQATETPMLLLSEALRGEEALLVDEKEDRFMLSIHPDAELAPRDVVARAIFAKQKIGAVYLDIRSKGRAFIEKRFPNITAALKKRGFDVSSDLIPVTPAAHFLCGGIVTDLYGRTSLPGLFAYGEVAATGVHGANRLASNSLLEGFVFAEQIKHCLAELPQKTKVLQYSVSKVILREFPEIQQQVKSLMWEYVGIERSEQGLSFAINALTDLRNMLEEQPVSETKNMVTVALLIAKAAFQRKESLGTHYLIG